MFVKRWFAHTPRMPADEKPCFMPTVSFRPASKFVDHDARFAAGRPIPCTRLWPIAKFPVLRDEARDRTIPESTILLEYVDRLSDGPRRLIPRDPERALECRLRDRLYDAYIHAPIQNIVGDRLRA